MIRRKYLKPLMIFVALSGPVHADKCDVIHSYVKSITTDLVPISEIANQVKGTQLIFLGESHAETDPRPYLTFIHAVGRPQSACLILEADSLGKNETEITSKNFSEFDELNCSDCKTWKASYEAASSSGWKVFAVDARLDGYPGAEASVRLRNDIMARRISNLFANGSCQHGIALIGKHHLMSGSVSAASNKLPLQLTPRLTTKTVDLILSAKDYGFESSYSRESFFCNDNITTKLQSGFGWRTKPDLSIPIYLRGPSEKEWYGHSNEFDFTIVVQ